MKHSIIIKSVKLYMKCNVIYTNASVHLSHRK